MHSTLTIFIKLIYSNLMKQLVIALLLCLLSFRIYATAQIGDIIIFKGDTSILHSLPLEQHPNINTLGKNIFGGKKTCFTTACWHGYQAIWTVIDDEIYLTGIRSCCYHEDKIKADLSKLFPNDYKNGKVKGSWVNGSIWIQQGRLIHYVHQGFDSIYEREVELTIENGKVKNIQEHNNYVKESIYVENQDSLDGFLYTRINWSKIPDMGDTKVRINLNLKTTGTGKPIVSLMNDKSDLYSVEALRVAKQIPEWAFYYKKGKPLVRSFLVRMIFNEENRKKYIKPQ